LNSSPWTLLRAHWALHNTPNAVDVDNPCLDHVNDLVAKCSSREEVVKATLGFVEFLIERGWEYPVSMPLESFFSSLAYNKLGRRLYYIPTVYTGNMFLGASDGDIWPVDVLLFRR